MSRPRLLALAAAALLALPSAASAASGIDLAGTVTRDGTPVENVAVTAWLDGGDMILSATTDADGAFSVQLEGEVGGVVQIRATGPTVTFPPDARGCVRFETPTGRSTVTLEVLPVPPVAVLLDSVRVSNVCGATATPRPAITPPATDAARPGAGPRGTSTGALVGLVGLMGLVVALAGLPARRRRG